ncbi:hypothetical protein RJ641_001119 [Dillenia turbinata]|uniref:Uncharacterized protein n=1 Tax=Dillenia turbinata TaxID=194707 RepID=A0AAN8WF67_9MAGN
MPSKSLTRTPSTGFVSVSNLCHILTSIGEKLEPAELDEWIREVNAGSDDKIRQYGLTKQAFLKPLDLLSVLRFPLDATNYKDGICQEQVGPREPYTTLHY